MEIINDLGLDGLTFLIATVLLSKLSVLYTFPSLARLKALAKYAFRMGFARRLSFHLMELRKILEFFFHSRPDLVNIRTVNEGVVIGAGLSLSSSVFVLQDIAMASGTSSGWRAKTQGSDGDVHYQEKRVELLRLAFPQIPIYARAQGLGHLPQLKAAGATDAILETAETSVELGSVLLRGLGVMADDVNFLTRVMRESLEVQAQVAIESKNAGEFDKAFSDDGNGSGSLQDDQQGKPEKRDETVSYSVLPSGKETP
ncbi:hypothetical protein SELMODRAFT_421812 [Selaginella moellendorffii]|uniref:Uncharacterized protein n=1 Tax=Selaginella moellendorffii TaxID=88036 RepID=D8SGF6_SELML|nr:hypothetical protein SELMODRAFT_421812 [Selaginella moellendorffii]